MELTNEDLLARMIFSSVDTYKEGVLMAKMRTKKQQGPTPVEEPWMVIGGPGSPREGRPIYLRSEMGITEERARELAGRLQNAVAVRVAV